MILALDCGSTNLKGALYTPELEKKAEAAVAVRYLRRDAERTELDADILWGSFSSLVDKLVAASHTSQSQIDVVALGSQAQTFTLLDSRNRPLLPFLSWMDHRATAEAQEWAELIGSDFHRHCSFPVPLPELQISMLLWVRRHRPDVWGAARRLVSVPGYFALRLSGVHALDDNLAAMQGLYSMVTCTWRKEVLDRLELPSDWLPDLVRAGKRLSASRHLGDSPWPRWRPDIVLCGNDQTVGAVGNEGETEEILATFGTALVAYHRTGAKPGPYHSAGIWGPYPRGGYYELGVWGEGCAALDRARERLMPGKSAREFDEMASQSAVGSGGVLFLPEQARRETAWIGRGERHDRCRAVLEGIGFALRRLLEEDLGLDRDCPLCAIGGGSRSAIWMQMAADITGRTVRIGKGDAVLGAAILAAGLSKIPQHSDTLFFQPDAARRAMYDTIYARWKAAWKKNQ